MKNNPRQMFGECPPKTCPADQPNPIGELPDNSNDDNSNDAPNCEPVPELPPIEKCDEPCSPCICPDPPTQTSNCLEKLINEQQKELKAAESTKEFTENLEKLLEKAKAGSELYTQDTYEKLIEDWKKLDYAIAELLRKLECAVWCWDCIIECHICPLLNELHYAEKRLYNDGKLYDKVYDLYDLQYWWQQKVEAKQKRYDRIKQTLDAWETPAQTIEKTLNENKALLDQVHPLIGSQPGKAIYSVFFKLVPKHLAIAPPAASGIVTQIDKRFTKICECSQGESDDCCGPDVGELSLRQRLIQPLPYLIEPGKYFQLICCLAEKYFVPAQTELAECQGELKSVNLRIENDLERLKDWRAKFEADAIAAVPSAPDCCDYQEDNATAN